MLSVVSGFNPFVKTHLNARKVLGLSLLKPVLDLLVQFWMVGFESKYIVGVGLLNLSSNRFLSAHCINCNDAARPV